MRRFGWSISAILLLGLLWAPGLASAQSESAKVKALEKRLDDLEHKLELIETRNQQLEQAQHKQADVIGQQGQQVQVLDQRVQTTQAAEAERAKTAPVVEVSATNGFWIKSHDGDYSLNVGGWIQADDRFYTTGSKPSSGSTFVIRRARPYFQGTLAKYWDYRLMLDFGQGTTLIQDAYLDAHYLNELRLRAGKFKEPVGLERLQDDRYLMFAERALPTNLVPDRDIGAMVHGSLYEDNFIYQLSLMNGVPDNTAAVDIDNNDAKDFAGRVFFHPFGLTHIKPLKGFALGVSGTMGDERGTTLDSFRTAGQNTFFTYNAGVSAAGNRWRLSPQFNYLYGPFAAQGEFVRNDQEVVLAGSNGSQPKMISNYSWQLASTYLLTHDTASFTGVHPNTKFDPFKGTWGAFELAARVDQLLVDRDAFNNKFASASTSSREAFEWAVGLNWYFNSNVKLQADYARTSFEEGAPHNKNRKDESVFLQEFQVMW